jgi:nucleoside 2-deoxyribosyltransferase
MVTQKIKCFIAMAFGHDDTDTIYDKHIYPVLKNKLGLFPIRIDRQQHKEDLNIAIVKKMNKADVAVVDLTYARPSVYYEAGYLERNIPVIYTVRKDHLTRIQENESLRVHFDLEMKQIVPWKNPNDSKFDRELKKRVTFQIRDIKTQLEIDEKIEKEKNEFLSLSLQERLNLIFKKSSSALKSKRFYVASYNSISDTDYNKYFPRGHCQIGIKVDGNKCITTVAIIDESITQKQIKYSVENICGSFLVAKELNPEIRDFQEYYYFCSLKKILTSKIVSALPHAIPTTEDTIFKYNIQSRSEKRNAIIQILSPIISRRDISEQVRKIVRPFSDRRTNTFTQLVLLRYGGWKFTFSKKGLEIWSRKSIKQ